MAGDGATSVVFRPAHGPHVCHDGGHIANTQLYLFTVMIDCDSDAKQEDGQVELEIN